MANQDYLLWKLCEAMDEGNLVFLQSIISKCITLDKYCEYKNKKSVLTPLAHAIRFKRTEMVKMLISAGASVNFPSQFPTTSPIELAMSENALDIFEVLIKEGADVHFKNGCVIKKLIDMYSPDHLNWMECLFKHGVNINKVYSDGSTPLSYAVISGKLPLLKLLLENGAKFSVLSALLKAIKNGYLNIVQLLMEHNPNVNFICSDGSTCLGTAIEFQKEEIACYLLDNGADPYLPDGKGKFPLTLASRMHQRKVFEKLLQVGGSNSHINKNVSVLFECIKRRDTEQVKRLIECGIKINSLSESGHTPLTLSVEMNNYNMVVYFVELGVDINEADQNGNTALLIAVQNRNMQIVDYLISREANVDNAEDQLNEMAEEADNFAIFIEHIKSIRQSEVQRRNDGDNDDGVSVKRIKTEENFGTRSNQE